MATAKRNKVQAEIDKARERLVEQQARLRELEGKRTELENMEIVDIVRGMSIPLDDLAAVLQSLKGAAIPGAGTSGLVDPKPQDKGNTGTPNGTKPQAPKIISGDNDDSEKEDENE